MIRSSELDHLDENGEYKYNIVIQQMGNNKWVFERNSESFGWIQIRKALKTDEEKYEVVIDD